MALAVVALAEAEVPSLGRSGHPGPKGTRRGQTWQFYLLWTIYFLGSAVSPTAIGESAPLLRELAGSTAAMTGGMALGVMSLFNGGGRLVWGSLSDHMGKRTVVVTMFSIAALTCSLLLPGTREFWRVLAGLCLMGFCYGGYLALMPALTAQYFGPNRIGANYGLMFTAWGAAGFTVPRWMAGLLEQRKEAGDLAGGYNEMFYSIGWQHWPDAASWWHSCCARQVRDHRPASPNPHAARPDAAVRLAQRGGCLLTALDIMAATCLNGARGSSAAFCSSPQP